MITFSGETGEGTTPWRELAPRLAGALKGGGGIEAARRVLAGRFGEARAAPGTRWPTGCAALDALLGGGLPAGEVVELVAPRPSAGSRLLHLGLAGALRRERRWLALVDAGDSLEASDLPAGDADTLLWVRARGARRALAAADLLVRDGNVAVVALDLREAGDGLAGVPATTWYRLQRAAEAGGCALLVTTPRPRVPACRLRVALEGGLGLEALGLPRGEVSALLRPVLLRGEREPLGLAS